MAFFGLAMLDWISWSIVKRFWRGKISHPHRPQPMINKTVVGFVALLCQKEKSFLVARVKFQIYFSRFFSVFFFVFVFFFVAYINDGRAVTKNVNFPVGHILNSRSKEPLPLRIASPRYPITFDVNTFSKNIKASICTYLKYTSHLSDILEKQTVKGVKARNIYLSRHLAIFVASTGHPR